MHECLDVLARDSGDCAPTEYRFDVALNAPAIDRKCARLFLHAARQESASDGVSKVGIAKFCYGLGVSSRPLVGGGVPLVGNST
jgi:hypothetical protein